MRLIATSGFLCLLSLAWVVSRTDATPNQTRQIVPGVWFSEGDLEHSGHCNNAIIEMKDYLIVVDANFPSGARLVMEAAKRLSPKPVKYVFDTHHHGDHAYGNHVWTQAGATTLAYKGVTEEMDRYEPARWRETSKSRPDVGDLHLDDAERPRQTFSTSPYTLKDGTREVQLWFLGWAHTRGDGFVFLPKERVLCSGDAAVNGPYNYTADGNIGNWPAVTGAALEKFNPRYVIPGHGEAGGPEILAGQGKFMKELHDRVKSAASEGKKLSDLVTMKDGHPAETSIQLSPETKKWVGPGFAQQVSDAYEEIASGKPHGDLPH